MTANFFCDGKVYQDLTTRQRSPMPIGAEMPETETDYAHLVLDRRWRDLIGCLV